MATDAGRPQSAPLVQAVRYRWTVQMRQRLGLQALPCAAGMQPQKQQHHEGHKAAIAPAPPLIVVAWPHDLHACDGPKAHKLPLEHLLINIWRQVANVQVGGPGV